MFSPYTKRSLIPEDCSATNRNTASRRNEGVGAESTQDLGLTRFREPIRVKRSSSVKGVEIDGKERKALLA
jgi:hypothetical protein